MSHSKAWVHRILGLTVFVGFWGATCAGLAWGLYAPLTNAFGWLAFGAAWAALVYAGRPVTARAMAAITQGQF